MQLNFSKLTLIVPILSVILFFNSTLAQMPGGKGMPSGMKIPSIGKLYGKVLDAKTKKPMEFVSVVLFAANKDSVIAGGFTKENGDFLMDNLPIGAFRLRVTFIGYKKVEQNVFLNFNQLEKDMGNITIESDEALLKEAVVTTERDNFTMSVDRKVYNVDKDLSTRGGTAVDVMKNVPSVTVDGDGNASLRNQAPQIYIDGRPTTLTLQQIPADQIDRVEVITNPSVKFDASTTGGILNIILKKNTKPGYNGVIMGGIGTGDRYNGMVNLNVKEHPFNFSVMYNYNQSVNYNKGSTNRTNLLNDVPTSYFLQDNITYMRNAFQFGRAAVDYNIDNRNTITLSENIMGGKFISTDKQTFHVQDPTQTDVYFGNRVNDSKNGFINYTTQLQYKHTFPKAGHELTSDISYNATRGPGHYEFTTLNNINYNGQLGQFYDYQTNDGFLQSKMATFQTDYVNPLSEISKLELGVRSYYKNSLSETDTRNYNYALDAFVPDTVLTNRYIIDDMINAAYVNYNNRTSWFSYQAGLRMEQSYYAGNIVNKSQKFSYMYPNNINNIKNSIFPGIYLSKKVKDIHEFQLNFSRKINRPNFFQLMPFVMFADKQNYRIGNPNLTPEFINTSELNYNVSKGVLNWLASFYYRYVENPITNIAFPISGASPVLVNTFTNGKNSYSYGWDNTLRFNNLFKKMDITFNTNVFYTFINWTSGTASYSNSGYSYFAKLNTTYRLPAGIAMQLNGTYEAPKIIPQGNTRPVYFMDLSFNKTIKMKWVINASISDLFNTKQMGTIYDTPFYDQTLWRRRETRYAKISVTYMFGKFDSSIMKQGKRLRQNMNQGGGGNNDGLDF